MRRWLLITTLTTSQLYLLLFFFIDCPGALASLQRELNRPTRRPHLSNRPSRIVQLIAKGMAYERRASRLDVILSGCQTIMREIEKSSSNSDQNCCNRNSNSATTTITNINPQQKSDGGGSVRGERDEGEALPSRSRPTESPRRSTRSPQLFGQKDVNNRSSFDGCSASSSSRAINSCLDQPCLTSAPAPASTSNKVISSSTQDPTIDLPNKTSMSQVPDHPSELTHQIASINSQLPHFSTTQSHILRTSPYTDFQALVQDQNFQQSFAFNNISIDPQTFQHQCTLPPGPHTQSINHPLSNNNKIFPMSDAQSLYNRQNFDLAKNDLTSWNQFDNDRNRHPNQPDDDLSNLLRFKQLSTGELSHHQLPQIPTGAIMYCNNSSFSSSSNLPYKTNNSTVLSSITFSMESRK
ncbi:expressed protein [Phakopsora pachyrhizi]|uniref:Expressed protein n=1 Tax=Phakopsora pachyrhizi TaxID=170000 RepID=A0AAV0AK13_PHAPC|nr:expressed protein [Phakopsora pachyrhizi]